MMRVGFTPRQVTRLTGVPYSTLNLWARKGLVRPSIDEGSGSGSERIYSFRDLIALKVAFTLRKAGVTTSSLGKLVQFLHEHERMEQPLSETRLVVTGRDVVAVKSERELMSVLSKPGQSCLAFVLDLPRTLGELVEIADHTNTFAVALSEHEKGFYRPLKRFVPAIQTKQRRKMIAGQR